MFSWSGIRLKGALKDTKALRIPSCQHVDKMPVQPKRLGVELSRNGFSRSSLKGTWIRTEFIEKKIFMPVTWGLLALCLYGLKLPQTWVQRPRKGPNFCVSQWRSNRRCATCITRHENSLYQQIFGHLCGEWYRHVHSVMTVHPWKVEAWELEV